MDLCALLQFRTPEPVQPDSQQDYNHGNEENPFEALRGQGNGLIHRSPLFESGTVAIRGRMRSGTLRSSRNLAGLFLCHRKGRGVLVTIMSQ